MDADCLFFWTNSDGWKEIVQEARPSNYRGGKRRVSPTPRGSFQRPAEGGASHPGGVSLLRKRIMGARPVCTGQMERRDNRDVAEGRSTM